MVPSALHPPPFASRFKSDYIRNKTNNRKLKEENTTFQAVLNEVRMMLAEEYLLNTELPISKIAVLLGYREISNFHRAFLKGVGKTPMTYRTAKKHRHDDFHNNSHR